MFRMLCKWWIPGLVFMLYFVYPIPHTIALRNLLLAILLTGCLWQMYKHKSELQQPDWSLFRSSGCLLLALTLWLIFQSAVISPTPGEALGMLRGDWLIALIVNAVAGLTVLVITRQPVVILAVTGTLLLHVIALLTYQLWFWLSSGHSALGMTPFAQKDYHSMLVTTLTALLLADLLARAVVSHRLFPFSWRWAAIALALCSIASLTLLARNAVIINATLLIISGSLFVTMKRTSLGRGLIPATFSLLLLVSIIGWLGLRSDTRWEGFQEAAQAAFDTKNNLAWLDAQKYPLPLMRNGLPVEESAYSRLAWAKVGLEQVEQYPLGLGYGHKAFGHAVSRSYGVNTGLESSHSGLLDFTLANGIPGLLLWLVLSGSLVIAGWRGFRRDASPAGLMLVFTVIAYLVRCLLDGHLSGFRLEMYAFLVGILIMTQSLEKRPCS